MSEGKIRWGLLGAGRILDRWMKGARQVEDMEIVAVASRTEETAGRVAEKFGVPEAISYESLLSREDIEAVYVPVPHVGHKDLAIRAMKAGKHVLVEKPATVTSEDFDELTACAREHHVFLMEAVWTRFFPLAEVLHSCLDEGVIGQVRLMQSSFSFRSEPEQVPRLFDPNLAGGALLDTGVYNLHFADMIFGKEPVRMTGLASMDTDSLHLQVDEQGSYIAQYDQGELAVMTSAVRTDMPDTAFLYGTKGSIEIPTFWKPSRMHVIAGDRDEWIERPVSQKIAGVEDEGYQYEIRHVQECIRKGLTESPVMTWEKSRSVLALCDRLRGDWGLKYPFE
ncbi:MAG: Gfo/Idh/MocA family oxidoreductase [Lachnospiraceae bacterium]|nr:Gfo/Idh/MocA family oxidoreductase [Lachnospiraceae bacterium]